MTREELEHIIRASGDVTDQYEFMIVGSQSILGPVPNPEAIFTMSAEADIYPLNAPELADKIEGALGEGSQFHETFGYYAQGVGPETAVLPDGWLNRVHRVQNSATNDRVGYCLDVIDLFMSKAAAARDKDRDFCMALLQHGYVKPAQALELVATMPLDDPERRRLRATIRRWVKALLNAGQEIPDA
ncbi:hypothetical protein OOZ63_18015 [Paucibacter sp. PLA-PC-4]|uniref:DUF6036 family nucleotidyltransferase n=1 Tax=Paucibacter sp. PLA-PC-4 TaxID=2993655 RepID=UPI00224B7DD9|nr:DUF6036 family nucleotidyltransferase [Paucibacter sp. PLA-PC-4]MCX2863728.1 hypothetical protein [Paucibacter sp. PLA-PC-4]